jgi:hypothetical protein
LLKRGEEPEIAPDPQVEEIEEDDADFRIEEV